MPITYDAIRGGLEDVQQDILDALEQQSDGLFNEFFFNSRVPARIGLLYFKYKDPDVDVATEQRTIEQETIDDTIVVQTMGRRADEITVNATVADWETYIVDNLTELGVVSLRTERWKGDVVVTSTDTTFMRAKDQEGAWLHEATIECLEVERF